jgi:hypothetical protein
MQFESIFTRDPEAGMGCMMNAFSHEILRL